MDLNRPLPTSAYDGAVNAYMKAQQRYNNNPTKDNKKKLDFTKRKLSWFLVGKNTRIRAL